MLNLLDLPWLPEKSPETAELLADRERAARLSPQELCRIARQRLTDSEVRRVARAAASADGDGLAKVRVCFVSQSTFDLLRDHVVVAGLRHGLAIDAVDAGYDQVADAAYGDLFAGLEHPVDVVFLGLDARQLGLRDDLVGDRAAAEAEVEAKLRTVLGWVAGLQARSGATCVVQNLVPQLHHYLGSLDRSLPGSRRWTIDAINRGLAERLPSIPALLFDAEHYAAEVGLARWHDPSMWHLARIPISGAAAPYFAHRLANVIAAARGRTRRALVLDLDNTLWGGVVGDDGVEGIVVGHGSAAGEAYLELQRIALGLRRRGVILAVASKNSPEIAREPFERHPEMLLRLDDFAVFRANWEDKASNVAHVARALNLGLDACVLVDDNPAERELVRRTLPEVAVPELGPNTAEYGRILMAAGYFEPVTFSAEDKARAQMYADDARRVEAMEAVADMASYLASLDMKLKVRPFDRLGRARIAQLINKSNQFNLTTRRYSEAQVAQLEDDPNVLALQVSLADRFGDNGMISVVVCRPDGDGAWCIDTGLMSCRVLKRRVEEQVLRHLADRAAEAGVRRLKGVYVPSARNGIVESHYRDLGFEPSVGNGSGEQVWWLDVDAFLASAPDDLPFELV
jgi:FkbH-like protein